MDNEQPHDPLTHKINDLAHAIVRDRNRDFIRTLTRILALVFTILTIIAIIIAGGITATLDDVLKPIVRDIMQESITNVNSAVNAATQKLARSAVKETLGEYQDELDAYRFDAEVINLDLRMLNLDLSQGFSSKEAKEIILQIESLVSGADEQQRGKLESALETAVRNFAAADRLDLVNELEDVAPNWFQDNAIVIQTMVQALGFKLLGDAGAPGSWMETTGSRNEIYESYRTYVGRAELAGYPELYLLYEMLLEHIENAPKEMINILINDANELNDLDKENFVRIMAALATEGIVKKSTGESERAAIRVTEFLCDHGEQGDLLRRVRQEAQLKCDIQPAALEVAVLNSRISDLDRSSSFTEEEAEEIISQIESLVSGADEQQRGELAFAFETAVDNFAAADRLDLAMRLDGIAPDLLRNSASVIQTMVQASGFSLLGDPDAPSSWKGDDGAWNEIYQNYRTYADIAKDAGYPELYLLHEMLLGYVEGRLTDEIGKLIDRSDNLNEIDAENFVRIMAALATEGMVKDSTSESTIVAERVTEFLCDHGEQGDLLRRVRQEAQLKCDIQPAALEVAVLNSRISDLDRSSSFTEEEAEEIISQIESLVSGADEQQRGELAFAFETAVDNFAAADRLDLAMRLDGIAPDLLRNSASVIQTMVQASGFSLLGDPDAPSSWKGDDGAWNEIYQNYRTYADIAKDAGYPELYLLHEMLLGYVEGRLTDEIGKLIDRSDNLNEIDAENFVRIMAALATEGMVKDSTSESTIVAERVTEFLCDHGEQGDLLREVRREAAREC